LETISNSIALLKAQMCTENMSGDVRPNIENIKTLMGLVKLERDLMSGQKKDKTG
jgi:hypothetical protein